MKRLTLNLQYKRASLLFKKGEKNNILLRIWCKGNAIPNVINIVDIDTLAFRADAELKEEAFREQLILFYFRWKYYYKNQDGVITDITPVLTTLIILLVKETLILWPFVGALDSDSSFIHNFPMLRLVKKNSDNKNLGTGCL
jgi:hypothetical protein